MLSDTRSTPVNSPAPGVIPDTINGPVREQPAVAVPEHRSRAGSRRGGKRERDTGRALSPQGPPGPTTRLRDRSRRARRAAHRPRSVEYRASQGQLVDRQLPSLARMAGARRRDPRLGTRAHGQRKVPLAYSRTAAPRWGPVMTRSRHAHAGCSCTNEASGRRRCRVRSGVDEVPGLRGERRRRQLGDRRRQPRSPRAISERRVLRGSHTSRGHRTVRRRLSAVRRPRAGHSPLELAARRETATVRDDLDVERWLDERGSFNSEAVTGWPSRRRSHRPSGSRPAPSPDPRQTYSCPECEHVLRVSDLGRHRAQFELTDERADEPVMNRVCRVCGHGLPEKNPV